jgi:hypothetical protein
VSAPTANDLFRAAQKFILEGQPVFPCQSTGLKAKAPLTKNGVHGASTSVAQVKAWWTKNRSAAIGLPTGILWDVLDVDVKRDQDGRIHLSRLTELGLLNGCKRVVKTPSGGWHLYFKAAPALTNTANATLGLDVRARGGYVLGAPSYLEVEGDTNYKGSYIDFGAPEDSTDDPLYWDLIVSALAPVSRVSKKPVELLGYERQNSVAALRGWLSERNPGERNNSLHWAVCRCIENGIDPNELMEVALLIGLTEDETRKTIDSALIRAGVEVEDLETEIEVMFPDSTDR